jgi:glucokinase
MRLRAGLDIGGTKTAALIVDDSGCHLAEVVRPTDTSTPERLVECVAETVDLALLEAGTTRSDLIGAGVGVPGQVDPQHGSVRLAVNLNLSGPYPLAAALGSALGVPVTLENDVRAAAWGAFHWVQDTEPVRSLAYLSIGTGIAAGLVLDGRLYRGAHDMAGEIGHISVDPAGPRCLCGAYGCLEAIAAGPAIAAYAAGVLPDNGQPLTTEAVYALAIQGDSLARHVVDRASFFLARAVYLLVMTYDVEKVVLGGGVTRAGDGFEKPLRKALADMRADSALAATMLPDGLISVVPPNYNAGLIGAVLIAPDAIPDYPAGGDKDREDEKRGMTVGLLNETV